MIAPVVGSARAPLPTCHMGQPTCWRRAASRHGRHVRRVRFAAAPSIRLVRALLRARARRAREGERARGERRRALARARVCAARCKSARAGIDFGSRLHRVRGSRGCRTSTEPRRVSSMVNTPFISGLPFGTHRTIGRRGLAGPHARGGARCALAEELRVERADDSRTLGARARPPMQSAIRAGSARSSSAIAPTTSPTRVVAVTSRRWARRAEDRRARTAEAVRAGSARARAARRERADAVVVADEPEAHLEPRGPLARARARARRAYAGTCSPRGVPSCGADPAAPPNRRARACVS